MSVGRRGTGRRLFRLGSLLFIIALAVYLFSPRTFLCLENNETQAPLFWVAVKGSESFSLAFRHSYDKDMYIEHYIISGGKAIFFTGLTFKSDLNGQGFIFPNANYFSNGWGTLKGVHVRMPSVPFLMGSPDEANHTLYIHARKYRLTRYVRPGTPVAFKVIKGRRGQSLIWSIEKWLR
jgi:hypothetical protein